MCPRHDIHGIDLEETRSLQDPLQMPSLGLSGCPAIREALGGERDSPRHGGSYRPYRWHLPPNRY